MSDQAVNAAIATVLGTLAAVLLLLPTAAFQYRKDGRLGARDLALLLSGAVYGLALWTYTLLPMPAGSDFACVGRQTTPFATIGGIGQDGAARGLTGLLTEPAFLQVALNVALFVPLGYFVRAVLGRGVLVATVTGLAISLLIETTQATGVWFLYDCAYRVFDVDDLIVNTLGASLGSLLTLPLVRRRHSPVRMPTSISYGRRLVGMTCDGVFVLVVGAGAAVTYRAVHLYLLDQPLSSIDPERQQLVQAVVPGLVEALAVLLAGRTVGEWAIAVRARVRRRGWAPLARVVKLATGVGLFVVLMAMTPTWTSIVLIIFLVLTAAAAIPGSGHRGLSHALAGMDLEIVRPRADADGVSDAQRPDDGDDLTACGA